LRLFAAHTLRANELHTRSHRLKQHASAGRDSAAAEIKIGGVGEEALIETPKRMEIVLWREHECAGHSADLGGQRRVIAANSAAPS